MSAEIYMKLSMKLQVQIVPGLETRRYKRMKTIIAKAGDFKG